MEESTKPDSELGFKMNFSEELIDTWNTLLGIGQASAMIQAISQATEGSLPLTVIGGFLGAGKTSLLNHLLRNARGRRLAVLVNDFGNVNIDASLIVEQSVDRITLSNGCVCCSISHSLTSTLLDILQKDDIPDAVVLEASGVSDPRNIVHIALTNRALRLNGVVTVLDAETFQEHLACPDTSTLLRDQILAADILVLNKVSLVQRNHLEEIEHQVRTMARATPIVNCDFSEIPASIILGPVQDCYAHLSEADAVDHADVFSTMGVKMESPLDDSRFRMLLSDLPKSLLRGKGFVRLQSSPDKWQLLQVAGRRWTIEPAPKDLEIETGYLVFIGIKRSFDVSLLRESLHRCI